MRYSSSRLGSQECVSRSITGTDAPHSVHGMWLDWTKNPDMFVRKP